ncbi:MAG TPA: PspA/IM30 family protein [Xanthomonadales bacterium]|nr:PspA/IM30 family protein [Xanthomonadales bacterium]
MALLNRVSQLFRADFNAVLDQIEEPEQILKQAIRDMEDELAKSENRINVCANEHETLTEQRKLIDETVSELETELDLCFQSGKEQLAKGIIRRKLHSRRQIRSLETQLKANERYLKRERELLDENSRTLEGLRQKAELFVSNNHQGQAGSDTVSEGRFGTGITDEEVEIAFLREKALRGDS